MCEKNVADVAATESLRMSREYTLGENLSARKKQLHTELAEIEHFERSIPAAILDMPQSVANRVIAYYPPPGVAKTSW